MIIGKYNVDFPGTIYDGEKEYHLMIVSEFDANEKEVRRKSYYVDGDVPDFQSEKEIAKVMLYKENRKLRFSRVLKVEVAK